MEKKYLLMRKSKGNLQLNVILILGLCFLMIEGLFTFILGRVEVNNLVEKEQQKHISKNDDVDDFVSKNLKYLSKECVNNTIDITKITSVNKKEGNMSIVYKSSTNCFQVEKIVSSTVREYHFYDYLIENNEIYFVKRKYYEIK
jgi:hypothetical protein